MEKPKYGVIVGRFQVPELHDGHLELFRAIKARHERVIIFLGVSASKNSTKKNPLDFETRRRMIQAKFADFSVHPLLDRRTDIEWSEELDDEIAKLIPFGDATLYGSRDSFVPRYEGKHTPVELGLSMSVTGTEIRASLTNTVKESYDFRAGIIYAANNARPKIYATVDIAIMHYGRMPQHKEPALYTLLARKPEFPLWRFVGGFAEPESEDFERDAKREAYEETGLSVTDLSYLASRRIYDWRFTEDEEQYLKSLLFVGWSATLGGTASDDIKEVGWFELGKVGKEMIVPEHVYFFNELLAKKGELERGQAQQYLSANG